MARPKYQNCYLTFWNQYRRDSEFTRIPTQVYKAVYRALSNDLVTALVSNWNYYGDLFSDKGNLPATRSYIEALVCSAIRTQATDDLYHTMVPTARRMDVGVNRWWKGVTVEQLVTALEHMWQHVLKLALWYGPTKFHDRKCYPIADSWIPPN